MPPPDSGHALTDQQIDLLRRWIDEGAKWDTHWAYAPPKRPEPPGRRSARLGAQPDRSVHPRAARARRAEAVARSRQGRRCCAASPTTSPACRRRRPRSTRSSPTARPTRTRSASTRCSQSPHYGERMAMPWLDAARYADTHGYHIDSLRDMWPWRDWVIDAFNRNLPFDQFAIEQLAGDLLPNATRDQKIASGFNRNHMINFEGGAIADEYQVEYVVDRVEATSTRVHGPDDGLRAVPLPQVRSDHAQGVLPVLRVLQHRARARARRPDRQRRAGAAAAVARAAGAARRARRGDRRARSARSPTTSSRRCSSEWENVALADSRPRRSTATGLTAHYELDGSFSDISGRYQHGRTIAGDPTFDAGQVGRAASFDGDTEVSFGNVGAFDRADRVQPGGLAAGPGQPADRGASRSSTTPTAPARLRVAVRRHRARRHPALGGAADDHARVRLARRARSRFARASG